MAGRRTIPLPAAVLTHLPLLRGALPCRYAVFAALAASLAAALFFAERPAWPRWPLALAACAALVPGLPGRIWTDTTVPCLFTATAIRARFGPDPTLLLLPYGSGRTMLWQASAGMSFRQIGGRLSFVPVSWQADPLTFPLLLDRPLPDAAILAFARRHGATAILAGPGTAALPNAPSVCGVRLAQPQPRSPR